MFLYEIGVISKMCLLLESKDPETVLVVLNVLTYALAAAKKKILLFIFLVLQVDECGGLQRFKRLNYQIEDIKKKSGKVLSMFQWIFFGQVIIHFIIFTTISNL